MNLKSEFLPETNIEDYYIEDIVQRSVRDNLIEYRSQLKLMILFKLKSLWDEQEKNK